MVHLEPVFFGLLFTVHLHSNLLDIIFNMSPRVHTVAEEQKKRRGRVDTGSTWFTRTQPCSIVTVSVHITWNLHCSGFFHSFQCWHIDRVLAA